MCRSRATAALPEQLIAFGGGFASFKSDNKKPQNWKVAARAPSEKKSALTAKMRRLPAILSVYMLCDNAITFRNFTLVSRGSKITHKRELFSTTIRWVTSPKCGPQPPCKQALKCVIRKLSKKHLRPFTASRSKTSRVNYRVLLYKHTIYAFLESCTRLCGWNREKTSSPTSRLDVVTRYADKFSSMTTEKSQSVCRHLSKAIFGR